MQLTVVPRGYRPDAAEDSGKPGRFPLTLQLSGGADTLTVDDVQQAIHKHVPKYYPDRQRLTVEKTALQQGNLLSKYDLKDGDTITFKDLGPQVGWRTVFIIEYMGPLIVHPLIFHMSSLFYGRAVEHSDIQIAAYYMVLGHYLKREFESMFVHRFSHGTMPIRNIFKNSFHYHVLGGLQLAYWVYAPGLAAGTERSVVSPTWYWSCIAVFVFAELSNLSTHYTLRNLRPPGTRIRRIPYGYGFSLVSCPNYTFELVAWAAFSLLTGSWAAWFFFVVSFGQIYQWAVKKHKAYKREFPDYPRNRTALIPFLA
ncbi:3-oxo-5-alpha-steroid 4-dehydrogenase-domain-containing protein [Thamnocephalis sphaerospora]|uniref:3-oxo-5-alpha-steroid 4-dehydrogenase-domain-containing protein n=1 Tax=Thamnocephalis sphaerospora TaxID=78915 RepID=A0A4P9XKW2_9FUNG|nr:3-oxo-5-alpha-steroid 4-dehydrogenase-domain-containing protein [Thamnocephalis sphaerospora]|eukprot:RKP06463.1 3-oxo-5-alpha-steroid 4-dehydrogenase-domain-containing protein [Thamnocephalis sphaerospora]